MERVLGTGGYLRAAGPTVFATFEARTAYSGSATQQVMLNVRVRDRAAMLAQRRAAGADVADRTQDMDGVTPDSCHFGLGALMRACLCRSACWRVAD